MKKLIVMLGILAAGKVSSQTSSQVWIGPTFGVGHTYFVPYSSDIEFQPLYSIGFVANYTINDMWGIVGGTVLSSEGRLINDGRAKSDIRLDYIRIPIRGIFYFSGMNENVRPKISFGPSVGLLVNELGTTAAARAESADFGMNATGGFDLKVSEGVIISAEVNYYQGFVKNRPGYNKNEYNGNIGVNLGLLFSIPQ